MLGELYQTAEQFAQASAVFRAYFKEASNSQSRMRSNARAMLIFSLIETEQYDEAEKWLEGGEWIVGKNADETADRIEAYLNLASVLHESGRYDKAATLAGKGYEMASSFLSRNRFPFLVVRVERNQPVLAALAVAANERIGRKKEADDLNKLALDSNLSRQPELRSVYETTLAAARLIGTPAPEIEVSRWIEGKRGAPKSLSELRGNVTLLNFWAIWSEPYANTSARLRSLQSKYDGKGLEMIGVTKFYGRSDTEGSLSREQEFKSLQNYHDRLQLTYPFAIGRMDDVTNEERYGVASVPTMILIDRRGVARHIMRGIGEYRHFEKQIEKLINEK
jgi:cytochrome c biogenesis protein CcmG, thiol:disulfide interchange protein DsbE